MLLPGKAGKIPPSIRYFDTAFAAPDGIARLRELILTLAMQGKLVEQDPKDPPASELLKEIEAEKKRLVKEGKIKKPKPLPPIKPEEMPYDLPPGWEWVRLGDICSYIQRGKGPKYVDVSTHQVISQKCVRWHGLDLGPARYIDPASLMKYESIRFLRVGDLLWNSTGTGTIGRACLVPQELEDTEIVADSHVTVIRPIEVSSVFFWRWIQSPTVQNEIEGSASGTTNQIELNTSTVIKHLMPLPPLPEQHRIVARIDQLMARCDALEKLRRQREEKRLAVHAAAIRQLLHAPEGSTWDFIGQHFRELYTVKENVAELRKAILQLAVMGRLVPQDPNDPPASELLKEIEAEKKRLVKEGKIKKTKPLPPIKPEEVPYDLPPRWEWVRLGEICSYIQRGKGPKYVDVSTHRVISQKCVRWYGLDLEPARYIDPASLAKYEPIRFLRVGDLLWNSTGTGTIGRACLVPQELKDTEIVADSHVTVIRPIEVSSVFLWRWIQSPTVQNEIEGSASGTTNQIELNTSTAINHLMPLPSLSEQQRIVARIDQLMVLCDTLEYQIDAATDKQTELLNAVMAQV